MDSNSKYNIALQYFQNNDFQNAMIVCSEIISNDPNHIHTYLLLGNIFYVMQDYNTSKEFLNIAIKLKKDFFDAYFLLGAVLKENNELEASIEIWNEALKIKKTSIIYSNIAASYFSLKNFDETLKYSKIALKKDKKNLQALNCIYKVYQEKLDFDNTKKALETLLKIYPEDVEANFDYSYLLLLEQNYVDGFKHYEYRKNIPQKIDRYNYLPFKEYKGEDLTGKKLLIYHEQGFGDIIQFIRFVKFFEGKSIDVDIAIQNPLKKLFEFSFKNINFISEVSSNDKYDYCLPLMSIAYRFNIDYIDPKTYLDVNEDDIKTFKKEVFTSKGLNIGLFYRGSQNNSSNLTLNELKKLFEQKGVNFYSLQVESDEDCKKYEIVELRKYLKSFYDTAVAIKCMNCIISIDSAVSHLSGALSVKTFVLRKNFFDFRWNNDNKNALWYNNARVFLIDELEDELEKIRKEIDGL